MLTRFEVTKIVDEWFKETNGNNTHALVYRTEQYLHSKAGKTKSEAKSEAARLNGLKGGRPRKQRS